MKNIGIYSGIVVHGLQNGRLINFPTANINIESFKIKNDFGVYMAVVEYDKNMYLGIANFGHHPTESKLLAPILETYILNFDEDLYGKIINVYLIKFLRGEKKFDSLKELKKQIEKDKIFVLENYDQYINDILLNNMPQK
ncbi:MAG: riboflavin kinase [Bacilli bacterium]